MTGKQNSVVVMYTTLTMSQITVLFKWLRLDARDARVVNGCQEPVRVSSGVGKLEHYWREVSGRVFAMPDSWKNRIFSMDQLNGSQINLNRF